MRNEKGIGTTSIFHIALAVADIEKTAKKIADVFGTGAPQIIDPKGPQKDYPIYFKRKLLKTYLKTCHFKMGAIDLELLQPVGEPDSVREFLKKNGGNGLHHILFKVKGIDSRVNYLKKKGLKPVQEGSFPGGKYTFLEFDDIGTIIEVAEF